MKRSSKLILAGMFSLTLMAPSMTFIASAKDPPISPVPIIVICLNAIVARDSTFLEA